MVQSCKNCNVKFKGNYCYNCGQPANTRDFDFSYLWDSILHIFHVEKGLLFTIKELFKRPGHAIRDFIQGKRIQYIKPLVFLFLMTVIYDILHSGAEHLHWIQEDGDESEGIWKAIDLLSSGGYSAIAFCFIFSLFTRLVFLKSGFNYIQHVIVNAFILAQLTIFDILALPFEFKSMEAFSLISIIIDFALLIVYSSWVYAQCFNQQSTAKNILLTLLAVALCTGSFLLLIVLWG